MSEHLKKLRSMSDEELVAEHDRHAQHTQVGINHYLAELARREQHRQTEAMLRYTKWITFMTVVITAATIGNLILVLKLTMP